MLYATEDSAQRDEEIVVEPTTNGVRRLLGLLRTVLRNSAYKRAYAEDASEFLGKRSGYMNKDIYGSEFLG